MNPLFRLPPAFALLASAAFALPSVGPDYHRPDFAAPSIYRDASSDPTPSEIPADWWRSFNDPQLDDLVASALAANQDLRAALARVEQARAAAGIARSAYLPSLAADGSVERERSSRALDNTAPVATSTTHRLALDLAWELDLFGRVRRLNEGARAEFAAAGATYQAARLALSAEVAGTWFTLGALDQERHIVESTIAVRRDALKLVRARYERGNAGELDVARAETELAATEADAAALARARASAQNALAVLLGEPAPSFDAPVAPGMAGSAGDPSVTLPAIPAGLPGDLLTRRPDLAAAERSLAAASARIGVAKAAFFPAITLTGAAGTASAEVGDLFQADSRLWSIGPSVYLPIFQGGRNRAGLARARAAYDEAAATYRQRVLVALAEVQDALSASRLLADQAAAQARAVAAARRGAELSQKRYDAGFVSYFEVVDAQRTALEVERAEARLSGQVRLTRVALIKALGGGWSQPAS